MREHNNFKYTCLFGGGAIRGAAHAGALKALNELGIELSTLAGSSVGSMVAAFTAVGYTPDEISGIFLTVNFELFRDISFGFNPKFALSKGEVFLDWIRELLEKKFYGESYAKGKCKPILFKDLDRNLVITSTNIETFKCEEFSKIATPDFEVATAIRISCCMPGLMTPYKKDDSYLVDGDMLKGKPMWYIAKSLQQVPDRILEIRLEGSSAKHVQYPIEYLNSMYSCMTSTESQFIKDIYGKKDKYDYLILDTGDLVVVDFNYPLEKRQSIIDVGYNQTMNYFKHELVSKKHVLYDVYDNILDKLRLTQNFLVRKKYHAVKSSIAELFIYLAKYKDIIDEDVFDAISTYQKVVFSNVTTGLLGRSTCLDKELLQKSLESIISDLSIRIEEIDAYLSKFSD